MSDTNTAKSDTDGCTPFAQAELTADAAAQVAWWALNLSATVEDAIDEWQSDNGRLSEDTMLELASHRRLLTSWLDTYHEARATEKQ